MKTSDKSQKIHPAALILSKLFFLNLMILSKLGFVNLLTFVKIKFS